MSQKQKSTFGLLLVMGMLLLGSCSPAATPAPTVDTNAIFTAAAQTVAVQLTQTAQAMPSSTPTPQATLTETPDLSLSTLPPLPDGGDTTATVAFTVAPIATLTPNLPAAADKAEWVSQEPADGANIVEGSRFDMKWIVRNVGKTTWNTKYTIRYFAGDNFAEKSSYNFRGTIKPGDTTALIADGLAPSKPGKYHTWWKLVNDQGQNFGDVDMTINVVKPSNTPTKTPTP